MASAFCHSIDYFLAISRPKCRPVYRFVYMYCTFIFLYLKAKGVGGCFGADRLNLVCKLKIPGFLNVIKRFHQTVTRAVSTKFI